MKKLLLLIMFGLLFVTNVYSQTPIDIGDNGTVWNDSLYYGVPGDSIYTLDLNMEYEWVKIFIKGNANSPVDTIEIRDVTQVFSNLTGYPSGTSYAGSVAVLKDSALNTVNLIINNTTGKSYTLWNPPMSGLQFKLKNYRVAVPNRSSFISVIAKKKAK